jgi:acetyl esterase/lipase
MLSSPRNEGPSRWLLVLGLLLAPVLAPAQPMVDPTKVSVVLRREGTAAAVRRTVSFTPERTPPLQFDLYRPAKVATPLPVVVFISGGEQVRELKWFQDHGRLATTYGLAAIIPDKRYPRGAGGIESGYTDTRALLTYLRAHAAELGIDANRICLWGFSAGGRLLSVGLAQEAPGIRCLVGFYGVMDASPEFQAEQDAKVRESKLTRYSPRHALRAHRGPVPPLFIARAGQDSPAINGTLDGFVSDALSANASLLVENYPEGLHGFDGLNDTEPSRRIIDAAFQFARRQLLGDK